MNEYRYDTYQVLSYTFSFYLNYFKFSDSCLFFQLATSKYLSKMIAYRSNVNTRYHGAFPMIHYHAKRAGFQLNHLNHLVKMVTFRICSKSDRIGCVKQKLVTCFKLGFLPLNQRVIKSSLHINYTFLDEYLPLSHTFLDEYLYHVDRPFDRRELTPDGCSPLCLV